MNTTTGYYYSNSFYQLPIHHHLNNNNNNNSNQHLYNTIVNHSAINEISTSPGSPNFNARSRASPLQKYECDEESQYSLSEFSHIHLNGENDLDGHMNGAIALGNRPPTSFAPTTSATAHNNNITGFHDENAFMIDPKSGILLDTCLQEQSQEPYRTNDFIYSSPPTTESGIPLFPSGSNPNRKRAFSFAASGASGDGNLLNGSNNFNSNGPSANTSGTNGNEKRTATKICRVCGDKAFSYNFNVITCESCKAFFRRNANKEKEIRCPFSEQCDITIVSRRFCQRCRLQKCFNVGMKKEWIMSEEARLEKKQRIQDNRERRLAEKNNKKGGSAEELSPTSTRYSNSTSSTTTTIAQQNQQQQAQTQPIMSMLAAAVAAASSGENNATDLGAMSSIIPPLNSNIVNPLINPTTTSDIVAAAKQQQQQIAAVAAVTQQVAAAAAAQQQQVFDAANPPLTSLDIFKSAAAAVVQPVPAITTTTPATLNTTNSAPFGQFVSSVTSPLNVPAQDNNTKSPLDAVVGATAQQQHPSPNTTQQLITNQQQQQIVAQAQIAAQLQNLENQQLLQQQQAQQQQQAVVQQLQQAAVAEILQNAVQNQQQQSTTSQQVAVAQQILQNAAVQNQQNLVAEQVQQAAVTQQLLQNVAAVHVQQQIQQQQQQQLVAAICAVTPSTTGQTQTIAQQQQQQADLVSAVAACAAQPTLQQQQQVVNNIVAQTQLQSSSVSSNGLISTVIPPQPTPAAQQIAAVAAAAQQQSLLPHLTNNPQNAQEMVAVPKDVLIKLVEHKIEADQQLQQMETNKPPAKCQCHCQCGRYPSDILIVDKVMTDILENSSKEFNNSNTINYDNASGTPSTASSHNNRRSSFFEQPAPVTNFGTQQQATSLASNQMDTSELTPSISETSSIKFFGADSQTGLAANAVQNTPNVLTEMLANNFSNVTNTLNNDFPATNFDFCELTQADEACLNELLRANSFWEAESGGENAFAITENNLRRLFKLCSALPGFRLLDRHDQIQMLREGCESYFVLRGLRSFNDAQIPYLLQNGVNDKILEFYREFPSEWRTNDETIILLLGMLLLFNSQISDLHNPMAFQMENLKYQGIIRRVLYTIGQQQNQANNGGTGTAMARLNDSQMAQLNATYLQLLSHVDRLKSIAMTLATTENIEPIVTQEWLDPCQQTLQQNAALTQAAINRLTQVGLFRAAAVAAASTTSLQAAGTNGLSCTVGATTIPTIENATINPNNI